MEGEVKLTGDIMEMIKSQSLSVQDMKGLLRLFDRNSHYVPIKPYKFYQFDNNNADLDSLRRYDGKIPNNVLFAVGYKLFSDSTDEELYSEFGIRKGPMMKILFAAYNKVISQEDYEILYLYIMRDLDSRLLKEHIKKNKR